MFIFYFLAREKKINKINMKIIQKIQMKTLMEIMIILQIERYIFNHIERVAKEGIPFKICNFKYCTKFV